MFQQKSCLFLSVKITYKAYFKEMCFVCRVSLRGDGALRYRMPSTIYFFLLTSQRQTIHKGKGFTVKSGTHNPATCSKAKKKVRVHGRKEEAKTSEMKERSKERRKETEEEERGL